MLKHVCLVFVFLFGNLALAADTKEPAPPVETDVQIHRKGNEIRVDLKNVRILWLDLYRYQLSVNKVAEAEIILIIDLYDRTTGATIVGPVRMYRAKSVHIRGVFMTKLEDKDGILIDSVGEEYMLHEGSSPSSAKNIAIEGTFEWKDGEMMYLTEKSGRVWKRSVREIPTKK